jgi:hypothetical protein
MFNHDYNGSDSDGRRGFISLSRGKMEDVKMVLTGSQQLIATPTRYSWLKYNLFAAERIAVESEESL